MTMHKFAVKMVGCLGRYLLVVARLVGCLAPMYLAICLATAC